MCVCEWEEVAFVSFSFVVAVFTLIPVSFSHSHSATIC